MPAVTINLPASALPQSQGWEGCRQRGVGVGSACVCVCMCKCLCGCLREQSERDRIRERKVKGRRKRERERLVRESEAGSAWPGGNWEGLFLSCVT